MSGLLRVTLAVAMLSFLASPILSQEGVPSILVIEQGPAAEAPGKIVRLSLDEIKSLGSRPLVTTTNWTEGSREFDVVPLSAILERHGLSGQPVEAAALNDYTVTIPPEAAEKAAVAFAMDGKPLDPADKGPFWIIFDFSHDPEVNNTLYWQYAVWQLFRLRAGANADVVK